MKNSNENKNRVAALLDLFEGLSLNKPGKELYIKHKWAIEEVESVDIIEVVDALVKKDIPIEMMKAGISKALNLLYLALSAYPVPEPAAGGFLHTLMENNSLLDEKLKALRPVIKRISQQDKSKDNTDDSTKSANSNNYKELLAGIIELEKYTVVYQLKENVLFPVLEKEWEDYRCVKVMWSIHDDIRRNLKELANLLQDLIRQEKQTIESRFNRLIGDIFFDMFAMKFREERILIPQIMKSSGMEGELNSAFHDIQDLQFPYKTVIAATAKGDLQSTNNQDESAVWSLPTGSVTPETLGLIFDHLPVDITFVDEDDRVQFYSDPPHRIFPRTKAVVGRKVQNCHPPESVHVVNEILGAFRRGEKDKAEFWINFRGKKIQISYYAVRNDKNEYKGVLEVSQEITEIQDRKGEKRLLDWMT
ncbi:MAG: DUF438 domain-containing protein [Bacteroidales bacterium]|nr:DUF438 domain-containing protein [Bacteroidales bacterium]